MTIQEILNSVVAAFEVDPADCEVDVRALLSDLARLELVEASYGTAA